MTFLTEDQAKLLHKLQMAGVLAFADINPVTLGSEEAHDLFKMNLPPVEWFNATGITEDHEFIEKRFIGVSENNCREQMNHWLDSENLTLLQQPNPKFGFGEDWLAYFSQPMESVNVKSLENHFRKWEIKIPQIPTDNGNFSALELAFDDCPEERLDIYLQHRQETDEKAFNKITPEQRSAIKTLQASGKGPKIDRDTYLAFTRQDAAAYINEHENNPENTFESVVYPQRGQAEKAEAFPDIKKSNLLHKSPADYLQRSILRDLIAEGHLATPETRQELLDKMDFITTDHALELIEPHMEKTVGTGLSNQCKNYIEYGKISNPPEIKTIGDAYRLYQNHRNKDFVTKSALRDLIEDGHIQSENAMEKIQFTTKEQDQALIEKYGHARIGKNLRNQLFSLMDDNKIGGMEDEQFKKLTVREGLNIVRACEEREKSKNPNPATPAQKELLQKMGDRGIIDLKKIDMKNITFQSAHYLIEKNIAKMYPPKLATPSQKGLLKILIVNKLSDPMPYDQWQALTMTEVSKRIAQVPEEKRNELFANLNRNSPSKTIAPER